MESYLLLTQTGSHDLPISHAHASPDGQYLSALSERGTILIYDISLILKKLTQVAMQYYSFLRMHFESKLYVP